MKPKHVTSHVFVETTHIVASLWICLCDHACNIVICTEFHFGVSKFRCSHYLGCGLLQQLDYNRTQVRFWVLLLVLSVTFSCFYLCIKCLGNC